MATCIQGRIVLAVGLLTSCVMFSIKADQDRQQIKQQKVVDETSNLVANTPTGFTYLLKSGVNNVKAMAHGAARMVLHPIDTAINVTSSVGGTARDVATSGIKKGYNMVRHPLAIPSKIASFVCHPIQGTKDILIYCDNIDFNNLPLIGRINEAMKQFDGLVPITAENCPELYATLHETAAQLGVEVNRIYVFKGNFMSNLAESMGISDVSCNAYQTGLTTGMSYIVIGKDLLLGVNRGGDSFVEGLSLEEFQAIFAHELAHQKNRHVLKLTLANNVNSYLLLVAYLAYMNSGDPASFSAVMAFSVAGPLLLKAYSRKCEKEADMDSSCPLNRQEALATGLSKLSLLFATKHRAIAQFFSAHPDLGTRLGYLRQSAAQRKQAELQTQSSGVNK